MAEEPDFGGYVTKAGLKCSDGRVIKPEAFQHMDGMTVPLVWNHGHNSVENILGHALLKAVPDGVYGLGFFNKTKYGQAAKTLVENGDIKSLSIYANQLKELNKNVSHGNIREVSLVLSGANPGALIDYVRIRHNDDPNDFTELDDEAIIHTGLEIDLPSDDDEDDDVSHAENDSGSGGLTVKQIYDQMSDVEKDVIHYMVGLALGDKDDEAEHSDNDKGLAHQEGNTEMARNVFEQNSTRAIAATNTGGQHAISHSDIEGIFADGVKRGSFRDAVNNYVLQHGIENIEVLFPDAQAITNTPEFDKRRTEWVSAVLADTRKTPFSRIKTLVADLTQDDARAKGYIKGNYKIEEWIGVTKRTTGPTTIYKKQKLDRDDILDIKDFNVVAWLMGEMRLMLEEELARAILIGDGRSVEDVDKIKDPWGAASGDGIRSILNDHEVYVTTLTIDATDTRPDAPVGAKDYEKVVDGVMNGMEFYKGTGTPTFYTTIPHLNRFKQAKDGMGRRYYETNAAVAEALGVSRIVTVEPMKEIPGLIGIIVNLMDYNLGTDKGGEITSFSDFDIDYNQEKYLLETRLSGALVRVKTALVVREAAAEAELAVPVKPTFVASTGVITIPTVTGVVYKDGNGNTLTAGAQTPLAAGQTKTIYSSPASGYYFANTAEDSWPFKRPA